VNIAVNSTSSLPEPPELPPLLHGRHTAIMANGPFLKKRQNRCGEELTTKLYDRTGDEITLDEVERIMI
jgi:hypothetical protein